MGFRKGKGVSGEGRAAEKKDGGKAVGRKLRESIRKKYGSAAIKESRELYLLMLPVLILIFVLSYLPLYGMLIAFQDYFPGAPILSAKTEWVGLKFFRQFIEGRYFGRLLKNTLYLSFLNLVFGFPLPILFALLLNEVKNVKFKKFAQTASYLPYFISMVVVAGIVLSFIGTDGIINDIRGLFGKEPVAYNVSTSAFPVVYTVTNVWKSFGWNSILYLSGMSAIDTALYESARIDGANRLQRALYITLPGILPTIAIMFIMGVGGIMSSNTDLILLLYNPTIYEASDVFGTYIYRDGITNGNFSLNSAVGIISSTINFLLIFFANKLSVKCTGNGMW